MSRHEQPPGATAMQRELDAIDKALAGETVTGADADVAELAVMLRSLRDEPAPGYASALDVRAAEGFRRVRTGPAAAIGRPQGATRRPLTRLTAGLRRNPANRWAGAALAAVLALAIGVAVWASGSANHPKTVPAGAGTAGRPAAEALQTPPRTSATPPGQTTFGRSQAGPSSKAATSSTASGGSTAAVAPAPPEPAGGGEGDAFRRVERSSTLDIGVAPDAIQSSAQRVFSIVSSLGGHVRQSNVTSQSNESEAQGGASFDIRVPSGRLSPAIAALARLGHVRSENDATNDVTGRYDSLQGTLSHARAERASLLAQLAAATSSAGAEAVNARLRAVEARIARTAGSLRALKGRLDFSPLALSLTLERAAGGAGAGNLTPGAAADSAAEILQTAFAVLLIGLAAALPVGLALLAGRMLLVLTRRRVREQALDAS